MTKIILSTIAFFAVVTVAFADDQLLGKNVVTSSAGAPFCTDKDQLQEYMMALIQKDDRWRNSLETCMFVKENLKFAVIEEYEGSDVGHVVKGRLFAPNITLVGYTLSLGLKAQ